MFFLLFGQAFACGYPRADIQALVERAALEAGLDPLLLGAVVWVESRYCAQAVGRAGEIGLGQVKPIVALEYGVSAEALWDPLTNLRVAARYLRDLYLRFGDWVRTLAAYNRGPTRLAANGLDEKGWRYAYRVLQVYGYWKEARR